MTAVVAEIKLDYGGEADAGYVRVFAPERDQEDWRCAYEIAWPGFKRSGRTMGIDSWQALHLTLQLIPVEIAARDEFKNGKIGILGRKIRGLTSLNRALGLLPMKGFKR